MANVSTKWIMWRWCTSITWLCTVGEATPYYEQKYLDNCFNLCIFQGALLAGTGVLCAQSLYNLYGRIPPDEHNDYGTFSVALGNSSSELRLTTLFKSRYNQVFYIMRHIIILIYYCLKQQFSQKALCKLVLISNYLLPFAVSHLTMLAITLISLMMLHIDHSPKWEVVPFAWTKIMYI